MADVPDQTAQTPPTPTTPPPDTTGTDLIPVQLSDGQHYVQVKPGTANADIAKAVAAGEANLTANYQQLAAQQNSPITAGSKIYTASAQYPNNVFGHAMAWLEQKTGFATADYLVNRSLDRFVADPLGTMMDPSTLMTPDTPYRQTTPYIEQNLEYPLGRVASYIGGGLLDLPGTGINVVKHQVLPSLGTTGDIGSFSKGIRDYGAGVPDIDPNAPFLQRGLEATAATLASRGTDSGDLWGLLTGAGLGYGGTGAGEVGAKVGGEPGSLVAQLLFGLGLGTAKPLAAKWAAPSLRDPNAPRNWTQALNIRPPSEGENFQGLTEPLMASAPRGLSSYTPSFTTLSNPTGQRIAAALRSVPITGSPIAGASEADRQFIQAGRDAVANEFMGGTLNPSEPPSDASLGAAIIENSRKAVQAIDTEQSQRQQATADLMTHQHQEPNLPGASTAPGSARVPLPNTYQTALEPTIVSDVSGSLHGEEAANAAQGILNQILRASPGGTRGPAPEGGIGPQPRGFVPGPPSMSWQNVNEMLAHLSDRYLETGQAPVPAHIAAAVKEAALQEQQAAADALSPGAGARFREDRGIYARAEAAIDELSKFSGRQLGDTGFTTAPKEQTVANAVRGSMQSPESFTTTLLNPAFPPEGRYNIAGQIVSNLGGASQDDFRPEHFVDAWRSSRMGGQKGGVRPGIEALTASPTGAPHQGVPILDTLANLGQNYSTPASRFGLQQTLGASGFVGKLLEGTAKAIESSSNVPALKLLTPWVARLYSQGLESDTMRRALAQQPLDWSGAYTDAPTLGSLIASTAPVRAYHQPIIVPSP